MDFFTKAMNLGFGAFAVTREKAEKLMEEMVEKGEVSREEAKQTIDELIRRGSEQSNNIRNMIKEEINRFKNDNISRAEFEALEARVKELENQLSKEES